MTQDFAKKKQTPKKNGRQTSNKRTPPKKTQRVLPAWIWVLIGVVLGSLMTVLLNKMVTRPSIASGEQTTPASEDEKRPQPRFDFYQLLKDQEVTVPDSITQELASPSAQNITYLLQAGSFRNSADADRLRAQLLLLNLTATIEKVKASNGDDWHRVIVGPFESRSKLAKARSILASNEIDSLLLKRQ